MIHLIYSECKKQVSETHTSQRCQQEESRNDDEDMTAAEVRRMKWKEIGKIEKMETNVEEKKFQATPTVPYI